MQKAKDAAKEVATAANKVSESVPGLKRKATPKLCVAKIGASLGLEGMPKAAEAPFLGSRYVEAVGVCVTNNGLTSLRILATFKKFDGKFRQNPYDKIRQTENEVLLPPR